MTDSSEIQRLLKAIDLLADRLNAKEKKFIIDMIDNPPRKISEKQAQWIEVIADKYGIY